MKPDKITMAYGVVIFVVTTAAWLWGERVGIDTTILWAVATPIVMALFMGQSMADTAEHARQAATQTNGTLAERMENAVTNALAKQAAMTPPKRANLPAPEDPPVVPSEVPPAHVASD